MNIWAYLNFANWKLPQFRREKKKTLIQYSPCCCHRQLVVVRSCFHWNVYECMVQQLWSSNVKRNTHFLLIVKCFFSKIKKNDGCFFSKMWNVPCIKFKIILFSEIALHTSSLPAHSKPGVIIRFSSVSFENWVQQIIMFLSVWN